METRTLFDILKKKYNDYILSFFSTQSPYKDLLSSRTLYGDRKMYPGSSGRKMVEKYSRNVGVHLITESTGVSETLGIPETLPGPHITESRPIVETAPKDTLVPLY